MTGLGALALLLALSLCAFVQRTPASGYPLVAAAYNHKIPAIAGLLWFSETVIIFNSAHAIQRLHAVIDVLGIDSRKALSNPARQFIESVGGNANTGRKWQSDHRTQFLRNDGAYIQDSANYFNRSRSLSVIPEFHSGGDKYGSRSGIVAPFEQFNFNKDISSLQFFGGIYSPFQLASLKFSDINQTASETSQKKRKNDNQNIRGV